MGLLEYPDLLKQQVCLGILPLEVAEPLLDATRVVVGLLAGQILLGVAHHQLQHLGPAHVGTAGLHHVGQVGQRDGAAAHHQGIAAGHPGTGEGIGMVPDLAVGGDRDGQGTANGVHILPVSRRLVAFALGAGVHGQLVGPGLMNRLGVLQIEILVIVAEADLGAHRQMGRHRFAHRLDDAIDGLGLLEQHGAPLALVDRGGGAAKVEIDAGGAKLDGAQRVLGQPFGVLAQQLYPHRRAGPGLAVLLELGAEAMEHLGRQQLIDHPDEFADAEVVVVDGGEHLPHQVIQHPLHGGQNNAHNRFRRANREKRAQIVVAMAGIVSRLPTR